MEFINPNILWGLLGISIPIAIHLLQLKRYKTVFFSDIRFLKDVQQSAKKQQRIRHWAILLLRIIAWGALTLAFAIPFIPNTETVRGTDVKIIFIDTSPSMHRVGVNGPLWSEAKQAAAEIVKSYPDSKFHIITSELSGSDAIELNETGALRVINEIDASDASLTWQGLSEHVSSYGLRDTALFFMLTDAQESSLNGFSDTTLPVVWMPYIFEAVEEADNMAVDSVWINSPVALPRQEIEVGFSLQSYSESDADVPTELWVNGELRGAKSLSVPALGSNSSTFSFTTPLESPVQIEIAISDNHFHFDDRYPMVVELREDLNILHIADAQLEQLPVSEMMNGEDVKIESIGFSNIPYTSLASFDLIIIDESTAWPEGLAVSLMRAVEQGASIVFFPEGPSASDMSLLNVASFGSPDTSNFSNIQVNYNEEFFKGMFYEKPERIQLPALKEHSTIATNYEALGGVSLLKRNNGDPSLVQYSHGMGQVYQWNSHLSNHRGWSELYPPIFYQMAIYKGQTNWNSFELGRSGMLRVLSQQSNPDEVLTLVQDSLSAIPLQRNVGNAVDVSVRVPGLKTGFAYIRDNNDTVGTLAYHSGKLESNARASDQESVSRLLESLGLDFRVEEAENLSDFSQKLSTLNSSKTLSSYWIIAVIVVLLLEMVLWSQPKS